MKYAEYLNNLIKDEVKKPANIVLYGQNINAGSCLGGITRGMKVEEGSKIINSTNTENSLVGFGFGLMLNGAKAIFFMKQMDFLLLGIDHLVNTYNILRSIKHESKNGSFTIVAIVVDSGYEGPQSSLNNFSDFCSIAKVPGFAVTNGFDADYLLKEYLTKPGFRIIGLSQKLSKEEVLPVSNPISNFGNGGMFLYSEGDDVTIVSFNYSFKQTAKLCDALKKAGIEPTHFNVNSALAVNWEPIVKSVKQTKKIIVVDDSKSSHIPADSLLAEVCGEQIIKKIVIKRELGNDWLYPTSDEFNINEDKVINLLK